MCVSECLYFLHSIFHRVGVDKNSENIVFSSKNIRSQHSWFNYSRIWNMVRERDRERHKGLGWGNSHVSTSHDENFEKFDPDTLAYISVVVASMDAMCRCLGDGHWDVQIFLVHHLWTLASKRENLNKRWHRWVFSSTIPIWCYAIYPRLLALIYLTFL